MHATWTSPPPPPAILLAGRALAARSELDLALVDVRLGKESGLELLPRLKALQPELTVLIITAVGTIEMAVEAMRLGADNFVTKPLDPPRFLAVVEKGLDNAVLRRRNARLERLGDPEAPELLAESPAMREALRLAEAVAPRETTVLLLGETGVGKGRLARHLHALSPRRRQPFVAVNCASLGRDLIESELFGHEKGAFTGAVDRKIGLFEAASGGALFLDEVGELEAAVQARPLKALEDKRFRRIGGVTEIEADARLVAATSRDLQRDAEAGTFRPELLYRLNVFTIRLPPLRERGEDVVRLAEHVLLQFRGPREAERRLSPEVRRMLLGYSWPGNVRALRNVIERATILCPPGTDVPPEHLPPLGASPRTAAAPPDARAAVAGPGKLSDAERDVLRETLARNGGNMRAAARALGISRGTLYRKARKHGLVTWRPPAAGPPRGRGEPWRTSVAAPRQV